MEATMRKYKRNRRFFTEKFKKEIVFKLRSHELSPDVVSNQYNLPKVLLRRWQERYGAIGVSPAIKEVVIETKLDTLINALIEQRLEQLLSSKKALKPAAAQFAQQAM